MSDKPYTAREEKIFHGVLRLAADGAELSQLKVQDIADASGMGKGTLYDYFRSKEEIFLGTLFYCIEQELDRLEALTADCPDFDTLARRAMDYVADLIATRVSSYQMVAFTMRPSEYTSHCCDSLSGYRHRLEGLLQQALLLGQKGGFVRAECDCSYFVFTIISAFFSYANALMNRKTALYSELPYMPGDEELRDYTLRLLKGALQQRPSGDKAAAR